MTNYKNDLPLYAEEIIINEEVGQIQQILNKFDQLVPEGFTELGQPKKYWGSTEGLDKLLCERYTFKYDNKSYTLDITQELSDKLELNTKENFCVKEEVLSRLPEEGGITINDKEEIFLKKPFTVENLEEDIGKLFNKIKELKNKNEKQGEEFIKKNGEINNLKNEIKRLESELAKEKGWWNKWIRADSFAYLRSRWDGDKMILGLPIEYVKDQHAYRREYDKASDNSDKDLISFKYLFKQKVYQYYRDK